MFRLVISSLLAVLFPVSANSSDKTSEDLIPTSQSIFEKMVECGAPLDIKIPVVLEAYIESHSDGIVIYFDVTSSEARRTFINEMYSLISEPDGEICRSYDNRTADQDLQKTYDAMRSHAGRAATEILLRDNKPLQ